MCSVVVIIFVVIQVCLCSRLRNLIPQLSSDRLVQLTLQVLQPGLNTFPLGKTCSCHESDKSGLVDRNSQIAP